MERLLPKTTNLGDTLSSSAHDDVEVKTVDTDAGVVLDAKIDVLDRI